MRIMVYWAYLWAPDFWKLSDHGQLATRLQIVAGNPSSAEKLNLGTGSPGACNHITRSLINYFLTDRCERQGERQVRNRKTNMYEYNLSDV